MSAKSNKTVLSFAKETTIGVLPGSPEWKAIEWNDMSTFGATIASTSRTPINQDLMEYEGAVSDLDSAVEIQTDLTYSSFGNFAQSTFYSEWKAQDEFVATSVAATGYSHAALSGAISVGALIYARNFEDSSNNGLKVVNGIPTTILTPTTETTVTDASPTASSRVDVVGVQGATGDIEIDSDGNLISTALDFTTLGLNVGQSLYVGGTDTDTYFATAGYTGLARVRTIAANLITLDKRDWTPASADTGTGKTIQLFIGSFIRNVAQDHVDFQSESFTFEGIFQGMTEDTVYEYPEGNKLNSISLDFPLSDKAGMSISFIGTDTPDPTATQNPTGTRTQGYQVGAFGTTSDFARLSLKDSALSDYSTCFKSLTIDINRNVSAEKCLETLGAVDMNIGTLQVTGTSSIIYNDSNLVRAARNNTTTTLDFAIVNSDGCLHFDIPSMKFGAVNKSFPVNESVLCDVSLTTFKDSYFGYVMSCTKFPFLPI